MVGRARTRIAAVVVLMCALGIAGCGSTQTGSSTQAKTTAATPTGAKHASQSHRSTGAIPPPLDPHDVYAADRPGMLAPQVRSFPSRVYVPNSESNTVSVIDPAHLQGDRHLLGWRASPARRPVLRPEDALGDERRGKQPDADRPGHRQTRQARPGDRSVQHVLHARRALRDRRRRTAPAPRLPRRPLDEAPPLAERSVRGGRPSRFHGRRPLSARELRVRRPS